MRELNRLRAAVAPTPPTPAESPPQQLALLAPDGRPAWTARAVEDSDIEPPSDVPRQRRLSWARPLARVFATDVTTCPCGGRLRPLGAVLAPEDIAAHLHGALARRGRRQPGSFRSCRDLGAGPFEHLTLGRRIGWSVPRPSSSSLHRRASPRRRPLRAATRRAAIAELGRRRASDPPRPRACYAVPETAIQPLIRSPPPTTTSPSCSRSSVASKRAKRPSARRSSFAPRRSTPITPISCLPATTWPRSCSNAVGPTRPAPSPKRPMPQPPRGDSGRAPGRSGLHPRRGTVGGRRQSRARPRPTARPRGDHDLRRSQSRRRQKTDPQTATPSRRRVKSGRVEELIAGRGGRRGRSVRSSWQRFAQAPANVRGFRRPRASRGVAGGRPLGGVGPV